MGFSDSRVIYVNNQEFASNNHPVSHYQDKAILRMYILLQIINGIFLGLSKTNIIFPHFFPKPIRFSLAEIRLVEISFKFKNLKLTNFPKISLCK